MIISPFEFRYILKTVVFSGRYSALGMLIFNKPREEGNVIQLSSNSVAARLARGKIRRAEEILFPKPFNKYPSQQRSLVAIIKINIFFCPLQVLG